MTLKETKTRLIKEYVALAGKKPTKAVLKQIDRLHKEDSNFFEWTKVGKGYSLEASDPFGFNEFDRQEVKKTKSKTELQNSSIFNEILNPVELSKLMVNHDPTQFNSSKAVLDGFGIDRLVECYAEGLEDDVIAKYLGVRTSQIKRWLVLSNERVRIIQQLKDLLRSRKINKVLDEGLEYTPGALNSKTDLAIEQFKLEIQKSKTKVASDLDGRGRVRDYQESASLPVVNLGIQVNVDNKSSEAPTTEAVPMLPNMFSSD